MEAHYRNKKSADADLCQAMIEGIFKPLGIAHLPIKRTVDPDGRPATPLMGAGMLMTYQDAIRIALLLKNHGEHNGRQILHRELTARAMSNDLEQGYINGWTNLEGGKGRYESSFWRTHHKHSGCETRVPTMAGFGGNYVNVMPNGTIGLRLADGHDDDPHTWNSFGIRSVSDLVRTFCP